MDVRQKLNLIERWVELRSTPPPPRERREEPVTIRKVALPLDECCRSVPLDPHLIARLVIPPAQEPIHPSSLLFLDIETTGLGTGPQCLPFLMGTGRVKGESFVIEQYFLEDPRARERMLDMVRPALQEARAIVTFNGRHFDWPVLREAYLRIARQPLPEPVHLDLLRPSRRVWRMRIGSASLQALEAGVLQVRREQDVPGWLVPALYAGYLQEGDPALAEAILSHNLHDILTLPALLAHLVRAVKDPGSLGEPEDAFGAGCILEGWEDVRAAAEAYERALERGLAGEFREKAVLSLAAAYRKQGKVEEWVRLLEEECGGPLRWSAPLHLELSRACERCRGDIQAAYSAALRALEIISVDPTAAPGRSRITQEVVRRLVRLERRMGRE